MPTVGGAESALRLERQALALAVVKAGPGTLGQRPNADPKDVVEMCGRPIVGSLVEEGDAMERIAR